MNEHFDKDLLLPSATITQRLRVESSISINSNVSASNHSSEQRPAMKPTKTGNSFIASIAASVRKLRKSVGLLQGFALVVGIIVGSGIFISPSLVIMEINDVGVALVIWLICGIIALIGSLCYCELGTTVNKAGGNYAYVLFIYGPIPAFLCAWNQALLVDPTGIAAITLTLATYTLKPFNHIIEDNPLYPKAIAAFCIIVIATMNCVSIKASAACQKIFTSCQILSILFVVVLGVWQMGTDHLENFEHMFKDASFSFDMLGSYSAAFFSALWAYNGWQIVGNVVEDMANVERNLFLTMITSIPFVIISYLAVNVAFFTALSPTQLASSPAAAIAFVNTLLGTKIGYIMPVAVALSCYGSANGSMFACGRVSLASGREGHFPEILGMIHRTRHTPIPAILLTSTIALVMLIPDSSNLSTLINFAGICTWINCGASVFGLIVLRIRRPEVKRVFKVWLIAPIILSFVSIILIVVPFTKHPIRSATAVGLILLGLPVYFFLVYLEPKHPKWLKAVRAGLTNGIKNMLNLSPCAK